MKPRFLAFPLNLVVTTSAVMAVLAPLSAFAVDYTWGGATDSTWTDNSNWTTLTAPVYGTSYLLDTLRISNGAAAGAVYNPGSALTTTFGAGRAFILGSSTAGNLTITNGTLSFTRTTNSGSEPIMANGANASLLINGGALDLSGHLNTFLFLNGGTANTSNLTISSGSFASNGFNLQQSGTGVGTINLDGGSMAVTAFTRPAATGSTTFNLDSGTLRARVSSASFLPELTGLQTIVEDGGVIIDTNGFNITIAEVLEHDTTLGVSPDGGLIKNGVGFLSLSGANTFTGPVTINAGTALATSSRIQLLSNNTGAGTGTITLAGSFTEIQVANGRNIANAITISNTGDTKELFLPSPGGGAFAAATFSGPITIDETSIDNFRVRADDNNFLTFSGVVSGPGGIFKYQPGRLNLTNGSNSFLGDVKITHGEVSFTTGGLGTTGQIRMEGATGIGGVSLRWDPSNDQDISSRLVMYDGKTATFNLAELASPYDVANVTFASAIGNGTTAALVKTGPGTLTLTQPSTYSGGTTLTQGVLEFPNNGLGTSGSVTMNGAILRWGTGNTQDLSSRIVMVNAKTASFSTNGNDVNFANAIGNSSTGSFTKTTSSGTLTLNGTNSYTGTTTVGGGTLRVNGSLDAASAVSVTGGNLGGTGTIGGNVTIAAAGSLAPGASAGTLTINGSLDISAMAAGTGKLKFELGALAGPNDLVAVGTSLTIGAGTLAIADLQISNLGGLQAGTYTLITSTGLTGTVDGTIAEIVTGFNGQLLVTGNNLQLVVTTGGVTGFDAWKAANGNPSGGLGDDHDGDGVDNGTEYFLFGNTSSTGFTALPGVINNAGELSVTWTKAATGYAGVYNTDFVVETSDTLTGWTSVTPPTVIDPQPAGTVKITGNDVKYIFSAGTKKFARLKVTGPN